MKKTTTSVSLLNYAGAVHVCEVPKNLLKKARKGKLIIQIDVIYGDECLVIKDKHGLYAELDRADYAMFPDWGGYDGSYILVDQDMDLLHDPEWLARKSSYDWFDREWEDS